MVRAILVGLLLTSPAMAATILDYNKAKDKYIAWGNACDYTSYTCADVELPKVKYKPLRKGLYGYYDGGDTIYIRQGLVGTLRKEVLMHEMVHFLQAQVGGLTVPGPAKEICAAEEEAFGSVDDWLSDIDRKDLMSGPNWWRPYTHCYPWYNPDWEDMRQWWGIW